MTTPLTSVVTGGRPVYAGRMDEDDPRVVFPCRIRRSSVTRLNAIAAAHEGWTPSDALRHLLALGLDAYDHSAGARIRRQSGAPTPRPTTAHPVEITPRQARGLSKHEQVTRRDR